MRFLVYIPRRGMIIRVLGAAAVVALLARFLPWWLFIPSVIALALVYVSIESHNVRARYQGVVDSMRKIHGDAIGELGNVRPGDVDNAVYKLLKEIASELERKNFQLVEKNIQLLSIKEIGLTLISSIDESKVVDAVINFLSKGLGYRELFVGIYDSDGEAFNLYVFRDTPEGHSHSRARLPLAELNGLLGKAVQMHQSVLIRDPDMHPVGTIDGKPLFEDSTLSSFIVVPLVKSGATQGCESREDCILHMTQVRRESSSIEYGFHCPACGRIPILGVVGVTDGFKAASLSRVDLVSVETLGVQLGTMLENNRLFAELQQEESFRDNVINSMMNGLITVDTHGKVLFANHLAEEITGYSSAELRGLPVKDLIVESLTGGGENPVLRTVEPGDAPISRKPGSYTSSAARIRSCSIRRSSSTRRSSRRERSPCSPTSPGRSAWRNRSRTSTNSPRWAGSRRASRTRSVTRSPVSRPASSTCSARARWRTASMRTSSSFSTRSSASIVSSAI